MPQEYTAGGTADCVKSPFMVSICPFFPVPYGYLHDIRFSRKLEAKLLRNVELAEDDSCVTRDRHTAR